MASVGESSSKRGKKRSLDTNINLIPYIDLMTVIITFLMMTAVWMQIASLEVQAESVALEIPPEKIEPPKPVSIVISSEGYVVSENGDNPVQIPLKEEAYDTEQLKLMLSELMKAFPGRTEAQVFSADHIKYDKIVQVIDTAAGMGLTAVSLKSLGEV